MLKCSQADHFLLQILKHHLQHPLTPTHPRNFTSPQPMLPKRESTDYSPLNSWPSSPFFTANMSHQDIQEKIAVARREADALKDKIKATKDQTADTSRELTIQSHPGRRSDHLGYSPVRSTKDSPGDVP
jgi:hypothetical protein